MANQGNWRDLSVDNFLGGPLGTHARKTGIWASAALWSMVLATLTWVILAARQIPCIQTRIDDIPNMYYRLCYTDVTTLYATRSLGSPNANPFAMEYPVLTGVLIAWGKALSTVFGARHSEPVDGMQGILNANAFFAATSLLMFVSFLVLIIAHLRMHPRRQWDALFIAACPMVWLAGLINWDMACVAFASLGILAWARKRPVLAGALWGVGIAMKLYPFLFFIPLFFLCLRSKKIREFAMAVAGCVVAWAIPNGVVYLMDPQAWMVFWTFNVDRGPDFGSIWYIMTQAGINLTSVSTPVLLLNLLGALGIGYITMFAPRRPRFGQLAFLMVCWFLIVNKVYSPQYVLWLLPLVVLARPRWRHIAIWVSGELVYYLAVWGHLAGTMKSSLFEGDRLYWAATFARIGVELWLMVMVIRDIYRPSHDPIRADGIDDPVGGVLVDEEIEPTPVAGVVHAA